MWVLPINRYSWLNDFKRSENETGKSLRRFVGYKVYRLSNFQGDWWLSEISCLPPNLPCFSHVVLLPRLNNKAFRGVVTWDLLVSIRMVRGLGLGFRLNDIGRWLHTFPQLAGGITELLLFWYPDIVKLFYYVYVSKLTIPGLLIPVSGPNPTNTRWSVNSETMERRSFSSSSYSGSQGGAGARYWWWHSVKAESRSTVTS